MHSAYIITSPETEKRLVPDSCCKTITPLCGKRDHPSNIYKVEVGLTLLTSTHPPHNIYSTWSSVLNFLYKTQNSINVLLWYWGLRKSCHMLRCFLIVCGNYNVPVNHIITPFGSNLDYESTAVSETGATGNIYELVKCEVTLQWSAAKLSACVLWEQTSGVIHNTLQHWFYRPIESHSFYSICDILW